MLRDLGSPAVADDVPSLVPLERGFFARPTEDVARDLLGIWLCRESTEGLSCARIVETEAYAGPEDLASHARAGRTTRTAPMFGPVGHAYVYLIYGMHECLNVVAYRSAEAGAVLLRALEPGIGVELMRRRRARSADPDARLCAGPARLCQAMAVDRSFSGHDLTSGDRLWLARDARQQPSQGFEVATGTRVGVDYAAAGWASRPWRFWIDGNRSVSRR